ncbi:MAG: hypothetical protein GKC10_09650 [Methanosarcinales archaeon]|nr:hypothetical protein [Methanosarcinales archaeon]
MLSIFSLLLIGATVAQDSQYCILRKPILYGDENCYEFYMCDASTGTRCTAGGPCQVTPLAAREGWEVDPNAHPAATPGPYNTWEGADYVMAVLSPYSGDWYECFGPSTMELPERQPVLDAETEAPGYCILRNADLYQPVEGLPVCFQFHLADTTIPLFPVGTKMATISGGLCFATSYAARQGWEIDTWYGGPYDEWSDGDLAMTILSRYGDDFYGCMDEPIEDAGIWDQADESYEDDEFDGSNESDESDEETWVVWYAEKIGFQPIYVTTSSEYEEDTPSCQYSGGGIDCSVMLDKTLIMGPFSSREEANDAICGELTNFHRGSCGPAAVYCGMPFADYQGVQHNIENIDCQFD